MPLPQLDAALSHLDADLENALERLFHLMRYQSVSTDPAYASECRRAAEWLAGDLAGIGFEARVAETAGHPITIAHHEGGNPSAPHLLFYGHYDVQPADPLELWEGSPFTPELRKRQDGSRYIHGRGASDDKGQLMTFVEACRAWKAVSGTLPCRITMLIEGEEESGGESLPGFLDAHRDELAAKIALICDTSMFDPETPAITTMLRGNVAEQVTIHAAARDLHSGLYGGAAQNPIHVLTRILAEMHDAEGKITIPGFHQGVSEPDPGLRAQWERLPFNAEHFLGEIGLSHPAGERGRSVLEQIWARPTAEVNGIWGGYTGEGFKTVIAAEASAKISFRLVGEQDPEHVRETFRQFVRNRLPPDCRADFLARGGGRATAMKLDNPIFEKARRALSEEWNREAAFIGSGGSIPVVSLLKERLGMESLLIGFGNDDDRIYSPNEKYELKSFRKGARSWARVLAALAT